jgi:mannosyl-glycoprotein endo-beta-N-acetylglucosaminidase
MNGYRIVTAAVLNVRSSPEVKAGNVIGNLKKGTRVQIMKSCGNWANISYNGNHGAWVCVSYLA